MSKWVNIDGNQVKGEVFTNSEGEQWVVARIPKYATERSDSNLQAQQEIEIRKGQLLVKRSDGTNWEIIAPPNEWGNARIMRRSYPPNHQQKSITEDQIRRDFRFVSA
ncbi:MAG: hypothetical protein ACM37W_17465 [Actinomycetota bacterium]